MKRGRKKVKFGKYISLYISNEANTKLVKLSHGHKSAWVERIIHELYIPTTEEVNSVVIEAENEIKEVLNEDIKV